MNLVCQTDKTRKSFLSNRLDPLNTGYILGFHIDQFFRFRNISSKINKSDIYNSNNSTAIILKISLTEYRLPDSLSGSITGRPGALLIPRNRFFRLAFIGYNLYGINFIPMVNLNFLGYK